jgi:hypothetical protein
MQGVSFMVTKSLNLESLKREYEAISLAGWDRTELAYYRAAGKWRDVLLYDFETGTVRYSNGVKIGTILADVDGYEKFYPENNGGYWEPFVLRAISDLVDELNEKWDQQIQEFFAGDTAT